MRKESNYTTTFNDVKYSSLRNLNVPKSVKLLAKIILYKTLTASML